MHSDVILTKRKKFTMFEPILLKNPLATIQALYFTSGPSTWYLCLKKSFSSSYKVVGGRMFNLHVLIDIKDWYFMSKASCHYATSSLEKASTIEIGSLT